MGAIGRQASANSIERIFIRYNYAIGLKFQYLGTKLVHVPTRYQIAYLELLRILSDHVQRADTN
jgi:hypothetical protein